MLREQAIHRLLSFREGTSPASIVLAIHFLEFLPRAIPVPRPERTTDGGVDLVWDSGGLTGTVRIAPMGGA